MSNQLDRYYSAVLARDNRFDGQFFVAVKTTGIYCRPICPAKPKRENIEFFNSASLAEKAGYRPCLRCRPESAPLSPAWIGKSALVQRSIKMIVDQGIAHESEEEFSAHFGVTARHLRRLFVDEIGKTPRQFYQEQRLNLARQMIVETNMSMTEIAFASGFTSLRRFNDAFKARFTKNPSQIRKLKDLKSQKMGLTRIWLSYRPPFRFDSVMSYLKRHALEGIEEVTDKQYIRYFKIKGGIGRVIVEDDAMRSSLKVSFEKFDHQSLYSMLRLVRRLFDLDADPLLISTSFEKSKILRELDRKNPGGRSPGAWDAFETAICVVLGQLVSTKQARRLAAQLVEQYGERHDYQGKTVFSFPTPEVLAQASLSEIGTTQNRKRTIRYLSQKIASREISLSPHQDLKKLKEQLLDIPGIGPWTVEYMGMRCFSDPDSFPETDLFLRRILKEEKKLNLALVKPWRSYAAYLLWEREMTKLQGAEKK